LKNKLEILAQDEILLDAIKTVFLASIDNAKPKVNAENNDAELGQQYRAYETAKRLIDDSFKTISNYKQTLKQNEGFNKGK